MRFWFAAATVLFATGCLPGRQVTVTLHQSPPRFPFFVYSPPVREPSERTLQFLRRYGLVKAWEKEDPRSFLRQLQDLMHREPSDEKLFAAAELSHLAALRVKDKEPQLALDLFGAAVIHAFQFLFDDRFRESRNPYDPQFRGACELYNRSLENLLRLVCRQHGLVPGRSYTIQTASGQWQLRCRIQAGLWRPEEFGRFEFVSDYEIRNLRNHYRTYGLGVPLIAIRRPLAEEPPVARFYPDGLTIPVTVFLRPDGESDPYANDAGRQRSGTLELYDPMVTSDIRVGSLWVPLQTDLTTPLAYLLADERLAIAPYVGLFRPEQLLRLEPRRGKPLMGLYMLQPYERGKIPVVMIHGLWSGPMTWVEMFNELRSLPEIRRHFQFWFYWYPTAQPFWVTAANLREELAEVRHVLDPYHQDWTLDQMVLVGHSMGGLLARLQSVDSGDRLWRLISDAPFESVRVDPALRQRMAKILFFRPSPAVARVIFIATPHRGSRASNITTQWIFERLVRLPEFVVQSHTEFYRLNRDLIRDEKLLQIDTSVEALDPDSPFFAALEECPKAPWVKWHSIIGVLPEKGLVGRLASGSDGVVSYASAHLEGADSEVIVPADHLTIHAHPLAVQEVRRILLDHLEELQSQPPPVLPPHLATPEGAVPLPFPDPATQLSPVLTGENSSGRVVTAIHTQPPVPWPRMPPAQVLPMPTQSVPSPTLGPAPTNVLGPFSPLTSTDKIAPTSFVFQPTQSAGFPAAVTPQGIPWAVGPDPIRR
ncbi:MAG: alpha/beta fold hydrolase [Thermoguttaceae bacterium]|nr:alpha/beta fold hydrolase [Thermoguttaceae bacterium]MDW8080119.1 alpha/beta fold hydrolase [Thermoguttaceae bacterium]